LAGSKGSESDIGIGGEVTISAVPVTTLIGNLLELMQVDG
jgi:hypothetical protein